MDTRTITVIGIIVYSISHKCFVVDGVFCYNCASTEHPGCGKNLDLTLLVKSSFASAQPKIKRGTVFNMNPESNYGHRLEHTRNTRDASQFGPLFHLSKGNLANDSRPFTFKPVEDKVSVAGLKFAIDDTIPTNSTLESNELTMDNATTVSINLERVNLTLPDGVSGVSTFTTQRAESAVPGEIQHESYSFGHRSTTQTAADVNGSGRGDNGGKERGNNSPTSHLMVECPGNACLTQRIPTTTGNVFVRTCDVSSHVPAGQCHLVTNVLGASVSVVCVCEGHFCNENQSSGGTTSVESKQRATLGVWIAVCLIFGLFFN